MIVITGATGALNGATTDHLLRRIPTTDIAVVARDVAKAARFADLGVEVRYGDFTDPASLPDAFAGADQLLIVSASDPKDDAVALHRAAIDAAVEAKVGRVLYTSHQGAAANSPFRPGRDHAATEDLLAASGIPWTALRNGFYLHSIDWLLGPWRETGVISVPADGPVSWTSRADAAEAAAAIIASGTPYDGPVTLTRRSAPTFEEIARLAETVTGRQLGFEVVDPEQWVRSQVAAGSAEPMARFTLGMYDAAAAGFFAGTDPLLESLLGREPRTVQQHLAAA
ncbi:MAG TPA: NAD(P)H-binding protein [Flexivirga sp.]|uniref:NmrA family NAD(P)-binding protein n=1 Tax=Flexivirga sp. TaxID=1962927 RepID=UPI002C10694E|nr:NAD(P)H-binding protein [Flexivirga sp.]HWC23763.1 NAD(P)H-binding protein [Flexivirga sp.]